MDNASIHNKRAEGTPKAASYKADMQEWLIEHDIHFDARWTKPKLWEIIKEELKNFPEYCIDQLAAECGKDIIIERTPPYHCELNPIEMCQYPPKNEGRKHPHKNEKDCREIVIKAFDAVPDEFVRNCYAHVEEQEAFYRLLDGIEELPVEEIDPVDETSEECVTTVVERALAFADGQVSVPEDANIEELVAEVMANAYQVEIVTYLIYVDIVTTILHQ